MRPEIAKFMQDVQQACLLLESFTADKSFADYRTDALLRSAVERQFITIGEALLQAERMDPGLDQVLAGLRQIIGFRHVLVHGYAVIDQPTVWGVVENDLPVLKLQVEGLLNQLGPP
jgi:uncharacterized protein with HEPN domain